MLANVITSPKENKYIRDTAMPDPKGLGIVKSIVVSSKNDIARCADPPIAKLMK